MDWIFDHFQFVALIVGSRLPLAQIPHGRQRGRARGAAASPGNAGRGDIFGPDEDMAAFLRTQHDAVGPAAAGQAQPAPHAEAERGTRARGCGCAQTPADCRSACARSRKTRPPPPAAPPPPGPGGGIPNPRQTRCSRQSRPAVRASKPQGNPPGHHPARNPRPAAGPAVRLIRGD